MSPHRTEREDRTASKAPSSSARSSVSTRKHTSKACEYCRRRRTKCIGGIPCDGCKKASLEDQCQVRIKARPQRPLSSRHSVGRTYDEVVFEVSGPFSSDTPVGVEYGSTNDIAFLFDTTPATNLVSTNARPHALARIEEDLTAWCKNNGIQSTPLIFKDHSRISTLSATPLPQPPILSAFEDALMSHLITSIEFEQHGRELRTIDRPRLLSLYGRYRAVPDSLTEDQRALIYASLCLARHTQISQSDRQDESTERNTPSREDVTYYRMAYDLLKAWGRPSVYSVWALFCLVPYSTALGGPAESTDLLSQMGWQVQQLGLHRIASAQWYAPEDMVQVMFSAYLYMDILRASITDLQTFVPLSDIEVEASPPQTFVPANLCQASRDTMAFMVATSDPGTDTTSDHFVAGCETQWGSAFNDLRQEKAHGIPKAKAGWATIRYHWMQILLHYPRISLGYPLSSVVVARAVTQILHTYSSLASYGYLNPSWPQLRRITVCGQLLLLLCASGEIGTLECSHLIKILVELLDGHATLWPIVSSIKASYAQAAVVLGIHYPSSSAEPVTGLVVGTFNNALEGQGDQTDMGWQNLSLMFDPAYFLSMTHGDL